MKNKVFVILAIGAVSYLAIVGLVLMLYQADPADLKWQERETYNARQIGQLDLGMSKDSVIRILGSPISMKLNRLNKATCKFCFTVLIMLLLTVLRPKTNVPLWCSKIMNLLPGVMTLTKTTRTLRGDNEQAR